MRKRDAGAVPRLRFREFREDRPWSISTFSDLYSFKRTNSLSRDKLNYDDGEIKNIHYGDIHTKFRPLFRLADEHVPYIKPASWTNGPNDSVFCEEGDIVLADASEDLEDVGKAIEIVSLEGERVVAGTHTILATRRGSAPVIGFGGQLFQSAAVRACIKREAQGSKVYGISATRISVIPVPIPPTEEEQRKIADCLGSLDDLIAAEGQRIEALRAHKRGLMQGLFPRPGETVPRLRFPEFLQGPEWSAAKLADLIKVVSPPKKLLTSKYLAKGRFPIIDQSSSYVCGWTNDNKAVIKEPVPVIVFGDHTCVLKLVNQPFAQGADGIKIFAAKRCVTTPYLYHQMLHIPLVIERYKRHFSILKKKIVYFPKCTSEQYRIADCLGSLDDLIAAENQKLGTLRLHKKGLMQRLFPNLETK